MLRMRGRMQIYKRAYQRDNVDVIRHSRSKRHPSNDKSTVKSQMDRLKIDSLTEMNARLGTTKATRLRAAEENCIRLAGKPRF